MTREDESKSEATLAAILRLLAVQTVEGKSLTEKVQLLERAGLERNLIAEVCGTSPSSVRGMLSQARKRQPRKTKRKGEKAE